MRPWFTSFVATLFIFLLAGCGGASSSLTDPPSTPTPTPTLGPTPPPTPTPTPTSSPTPTPTPTPAPSPTPTPSPTPNPDPTPTPASNPQAVVTRYYDNTRSGVNSQESILNPTTVVTGSFGKLFTLPVDEFVYGQPLYVPGLSIPGQGTHNVIFVATENDTVYAFDADQKGAPLWSTSLLGSGEEALPCAGVNSTDNLDGCGIAPVIGVTATPVISLENNAIYVEARSASTTGTYFHRLHALNLTTGAEMFGGPVTIQASAPGTASDADANGDVDFNPLRENSRPGLLLVNGVVYMCFASLSDVTPYHGWLLGYSATTLQQVSVFITTPNGHEGGIWANTGPTADSNGNIFLVSGNGTPDPSDNNYGQSYIKLTPQSGQLEPADYFTTSEASALNIHDSDIGSAGLMLLPDQTGTAHPHMLVGAGKEGTIFLVDRDNMGKLNAAGDQNVQSIPNAVGNVADCDPDGTNGGQFCNFYSPVFFNGNVYFSGVDDVIKAFSLQNALLSTTPVMQSGTPFSFPGAGLTISNNGGSGAILWALEWKNAAAGKSTLHAYDPGNLSTELWNSDQSASDTLGVATRLNIPLVANGKVYVGGTSSVTVYGILP